MQNSCACSTISQSYKSLGVVYKDYGLIYPYILKFSKVFFGYGSLHLLPLYGHQLHWKINICGEIFFAGWRWCTFPNSNSESPGLLVIHRRSSIRTFSRFIWLVCALQIEYLGHQRSGNVLWWNELCNSLQHAGWESNRTTIFPLLNSPLSSAAPLFIFLAGCVYMYRVSRLSAALWLRSYSC